MKAQTVRVGGAVTAFAFVLTVVAGVSVASAATRCTIIGTNGADVLQGTDGPDVICALGGDDEIYGLAGDDLIYGGKGDDVIDAGAGNDRAFGIDGDDTIVGGPGDDRIGGGAGNDTIRGGAGDDKLYGASGDDLIEGGAGRDLGWGDGGDDVVYAFGPSGSEDDKNILGGGPGFDTLIGSDGSDLIYPSADGATIDAGAGSDVITGNTEDFGDLFVDAGPGNDRLNIDYRDNLLQTFGEIDINMGPGNDFVNLWVDDGPAVGEDFLVADSVSISTGRGDDVLQLMIIGLVDGNVAVDLGEGDDTYWNNNEFVVNGDATVALGEGDNVMSSQGLQEIRGDYLVTGGSGSDEIVSTFAVALLVGGTHRIETFGGADIVGVVEHIGLSNSATLEVFLGDGNDALATDRATFPNEGMQTALLNAGSFIDGGPGLDSIALRSDGVPLNLSGTAALPGVEIVAGTAWEAQCELVGFDDDRCP